MLNGVLAHPHACMRLSRSPPCVGAAPRLDATTLLTASGPPTPTIAGPGQPPVPGGHAGARVCHLRLKEEAAVHRVLGLPAHLAAHAAGAAARQGLLFQVRMQLPGGALGWLRARMRAHVVPATLSPDQPPATPPPFQTTGPRTSPQSTRRRWWPPARPGTSSAAAPPPATSWRWSATSGRSLSTPGRSARAGSGCVSGGAPRLGPEGGEGGGVCSGRVDEPPIFTLGSPGGCLRTERRPRGAGVWGAPPSSASLPVADLCCQPPPLTPRPPSPRSPPHASTNDCTQTTTPL